MLTASCSLMGKTRSKTFTFGLTKVKQNWQLRRSPKVWLANHLPKMDHRSSKLLCFDLLYKSKLKYALLASNELIPK